MPEVRRYARVRPTGRMSSAGKIVIDPKSSPVDCTIVDISTGGACLQINKLIDLPKRFELVHSGTRKKCTVVWKSRYRIGVLF